VRERLDHLVSEMFDRGIRLEDAMHEVEKRFIVRALHASDGNIGDAASRLGLHRNTLSRKIAEYKLRPSRG
jgi:DNA-binding NtrC family response regulator